jgi:hypothetical protein
LLTVDCALILTNASTSICSKIKGTHSHSNENSLGIEAE